MGLKEKVMNRLFGVKQTIKQDLKNKKEEDSILNNKNIEKIESIMEDMYQKGINISKKNPVESFLNVLNNKSEDNMYSEEQRNSYKKLLKDLKGLTENEKNILLNKLTDELEQEEEEER